MHARTRTIFIVIIAIALLYAAIFLYRQQQLYKQSCFKPSGFKIKKLTLFDTDINLNLEFKNKTDLDFNIIKQEFDIYINEYPVVHITGNEKIIARPNMPATIPLNIVFNPAETLKIGLNNIGLLFQDKNKIRITVKGYLNLSSGVVFVNRLPVNISYTLGELLTNQPLPC